MHEALQYYTKLEALVKEMRLEYWRDRNYNSRQAREKVHTIGLKLDKLIRAENERKKQVQKEFDYAEAKPHR